MDLEWSSDFSTEKGNSPRTLTHDFKQSSIRGVINIEKRSSVVWWLLPVHQCWYPLLDLVCKSWRYHRWRLSDRLGYLRRCKEGWSNIPWFFLYRWTKKPNWKDMKDRLVSWVGFPELWMQRWWILENKMWIVNKVRVDEEFKKKMISSRKSLFEYWKDCDRTSGWSKNSTGIPVISVNGNGACTCLKCEQNQPPLLTFWKSIHFATVMWAIPKDYDLDRFCSSENYEWMKKMQRYSFESTWEYVDNKQTSAFFLTIWIFIVVRILKNKDKRYDNWTQNSNTVSNKKESMLTMTSQKRHWAALISGGSPFCAKIEYSPRNHIPCRNIGRTNLNRTFWAISRSRRYRITRLSRSVSQHFETLCEKTEALDPRICFIWDKILCNSRFQISFRDMIERTSFLMSTPGSEATYSMKVSIIMQLSECVDQPARIEMISWFIWFNNHIKNITKGEKSITTTSKLPSWKSREKSQRHIWSSLVWLSQPGPSFTLIRASVHFSGECGSLDSETAS
jgi:hypothetical protein